MQSLADDALLNLVRQGDGSAFAELYHRHAADALRYASRLSHRYLQRDAGEDVLGEAVRKMLSAVDGGHGPEIGFRQYLFTAIRSVVIRTKDTLAREDVVDMLPDDELPAPEGDLDTMLLRTAFSSLPTRSRYLLWSSKVDGLPPHEIARLLQVPVAQVPTMTKRAREALQIAYVRAHLPSLAVRECSVTVRLLARRAVVELSIANRRLLAAHLAQCTRCRHTAAELERDVLSSWRHPTLVRRFPTRRPPPDDLSEEVA